jgi:undecaprenyl-diphosphatase
MHWILALDTHAALYLNALAQQSRVLTRLAIFLLDSDFLKGGVITAIIVWLWFKSDARQTATRLQIVMLCAGAAIAVVFSRLAQQALPFRLRPIHDPALNLIPPYGLNPETLAHWSSFPSDNAVLYGALATGLFLISRAGGLLGWAWTLGVILTPRLFLGLHFLSDVYAGLAFGALIMTIAFRLKSCLGRSIGLLLQIEKSRPGFYYAIGLLFIWQIDTAFPECRAGLRMALELFQTTAIASDGTAHPWEASYERADNP